MEETIVTVLEDVGVMNLCANITSGQLERDVEVSVVFIDITARSK